VTSPVRPPGPQDLAWAELAAELTPAKTLARIDAVTARVVTTVTVVGLLLTGLGALSAGLPNQGEPAKALAIAAVVSAVLSVAAALVAQVLTISHRFNPANRAAVRAWYRRQFDIRAYPTQVATVLLLAAVLLAGATAAAELVAPAAAGTSAGITVMQVRQPGTTASTGQAAVSVTVTFRGLVPGQVVTLIVTTSGSATPLARVASTAAPDGTATATVALQALPAAHPVIVTARAPRQQCRAVLAPARATPTLRCRA
jgi:hypothetical protein